MKKHPNLFLGLTLAVLLAAGSLQGRRVDHLRDSDRFYRWILTACTQVRMSGRPGFQSSAFDPEELKDDELFAQLVAETDKSLPDIPLRDQDYDGEGVPLPKVVRYSAPGGAEQDTAEVSGSDTKEQRDRDRKLWALASGKELAPVRTLFHEYVREDKLSGLGSQFDLETMYTQQQETVSLGNMFFGFRKMAANLLWLKVDKLWHEGYEFRMVPLMNTCVALDPTFVDAYLVGAWHLSYNATAGLDPTPWEMRVFLTKYKDWVGPKEKLYYDGIEFLSDGILKNPRNYKLYFDLGYAIYEEKLMNHSKAVEYLSEAIRLWHDVWVPRTLYRCMENNGQYEEAKAGWERYMERYPDSKSSKDVAPRFVRINQGYIYKRDAERCIVRAEAHEELMRRAEARAQQAIEAAGQAQAAGNTDEAGKQQAAADAAVQQAGEYQAQAKAARDEAAQLREKARAIWDELMVMTDGAETAAIGEIARAEAIELAEQERYYEAIAILEKARFESNRFYWDALDIMLDIKQKADIPLSVSESRYLARNDLERVYTALLPKSIDGTDFEFRGDRWYQEKFGPDAGMPEPVEPGSDRLLELEAEHPEIAPYFDLEGPIVFKAGDQWYQYMAELPSDLRLPQAEKDS